MDYLTQQEAAEVLKVSVRTIRRYAKRGILATIREKGRVLYSIDSVAAKKQDPGGESLKKSLANLQIEVQKLNARVNLLETVLGARGNMVSPKDIEVSALKNAIALHRKLKEIPFDAVRGWSDDLIRFNAALCKEIGFGYLRTFVDRLILNAEKSKEFNRYPSRRIYVDKLKLFRQQLSGYAATYRAETKSHQAAEPEAKKS